MATSLPMLKRPKQSGNRAIFRRGRNVAGTLEVPCPFRVYARKHGFNYPEDYCKEGHTFKGNEKLKFVNPLTRISPVGTNLFITTKRAYF